MACPGSHYREFGVITSICLFFSEHFRKLFLETTEIRAEMTNDCFEEFNSSHTAIFSEIWDFQRLVKSKEHKLSPAILFPTSEQQNRRV